MNDTHVPVEVIQAEIRSASEAHQQAQQTARTLHAQYHQAVEQELVALARLNRAHAALAEYYEARRVAATETAA